MKPEIKQRIEQIRRGEVPDGYKRSKLGIIPEQWCIQQLQEIASISSGSTPNRSKTEYWNGNIPWVTTSELSLGYVTKTNEAITAKAISESRLKIYSPDTLLIAMYGQGKTRGTVAKLKIQATINQACAAISLNKGNPDYIFYVLQNAYDKIRRLSNSGNQENLNADIIKTYSIFFPSIDEQQKITTILTRQDKLIELKQRLLTQKLQEKKYWVQLFLTGKKRLHGFNLKWKHTKLNTILVERQEKNLLQNHRICSVAVQKGIVDQIEHLGRSYAAENTSNYGIVHYGDIVYTKSPTGDFPYGIIKQSQFDEDVAVSPLYGVYKPINYEIGYLLHTFFSYSINCSNYLLPIIQKGAKNTINISNETFISKDLYLPVDYKEQLVLAKLFIETDRELNLLQKDIELEKRKKKALMQLLLTGIVRV